MNSFKFIEYIKRNFLIFPMHLTQKEGKQANNKIFTRYITRSACSISFSTVTTIFLLALLGFIEVVNKKVQRIAIPREPIYTDRPQVLSVN